MLSEQAARLGMVRAHTLPNNITSSVIKLAFQCQTCSIELSITKVRHV
jgi:hypothetical protein